jgi:lipoate-protein ligase A
VALDELLPQLPSAEATAAALRDGLADVLGVRFEPGELTLRERALAEELLRDKYATPQWLVRS